MMTRTWKYLLGCTAVLASFQAAAQIRLYEHDGFRGRSFTADGPLGDFTRAGFNDRASSVVVGGGRWILCDNARFGGNCVRLRPGRYPSLSAIGLNDRVSSARPDDGGGYSERERGSGFRGSDGFRDPQYREHQYRDHGYRERDGFRAGDRDGFRDGDGRYRDRDGRSRDRDGRVIGG
ncbi:MAG TPA: beta/gamma crystallin-related protein, partial [Caldimonas sp.]